MVPGSAGVGCHCAVPTERCFPLCAAVKKPAPAPPKPGNPPPGQPGGQSAPGTAQQTPSLSLKAATGNPSPPVPHAGPAPGQPCATSQLCGPRRASGSLAPMQAPSHPPPQPPTQAPQSQARPGEQGLEQPTHTPPRTPTPPSTPPLAKQSPGLLATQHPVAGHPETAQPHAGTLPRPRPVPKPRNRPSVPPPPHPPGAHPAADGSLSSAVPTASKIVTGEYELAPGFCTLSRRLVYSRLTANPAQPGGATPVCPVVSAACAGAAELSERRTVQSPEVCWA